jgi:teichuronopeptide biosynthesis TupA-like protein
VLASRRVRGWWQLVRAGRDPRWQGKVVRPRVRWVASKQKLSFETLAKLECVARRLLGQRLSERAWDKMTFNDKVTYRRLRVRDPVLQQLSDKLSMRDYIAERLGPESLPVLLAVGKRASELGQRRGPFVLKANHGSDMVTIVAPGDLLSREQLVRADAWLTVDYAWTDLEWGYLGARRLLLVEEFLQGPAPGEPPPDYKLFTFHGEVQMIQTVSGRFADYSEVLRRPDWSPIPGMYVNMPRTAEPAEDPPETLELMLRWAGELGRDLDFVRVDLYDVNGQLKVGELTPYPTGGNLAFTPASIDAWLGGLWSRAPSR